jgi:hypothetical protein
VGTEDSIAYLELMSGAPELNPADFPDFPPMDPTGTVDLEQLQSNLFLTPAERLRRHDHWLRFVKAIHRDFRKRHGIEPADLHPPE